MTHLLSQRVVVGALGIIPRGIAPPARELVPNFTQRTFQLRCNALQQRGAGVRGRAAITDVAEREETSNCSASPAS